MNDTSRPGPPAEEPDEAFERLRAADPAANAEPDRAALGEAVRGRIAGDGPAAASHDAAGTGRAEGAGSAEGADADAGAGPGGGASDDLPDELEVHRARRRRRAPLQVAAAVAGALVVGAGGYALGTTGAGTGADTAAGALAPISLTQEGWAGDAADGGATEESAALSADGAGAARDTASSSVYWGGRQVFSASGLGTQRTTAEAFAYDAAGVFSEETVLRLADAFGIEGETWQEWGAWHAGSRDGSTASVTLEPDGTGSFWFSDPEQDPWYCGPVRTFEEPEDADGAEGEGSSGAEVLPDLGVVDECVERDLGDAPGEREAIAALRDAIAAVGLDPDDYEFTSDGHDAAWRWVEAGEVVDGRLTSSSWSASFSGGGVQHLSGQLAPRVSIGTYDVVSETEAVERLGDPRFDGGSYGPIAFARDAFDDEWVEGPDPTVPPTVASGARIGWPVSEVTIVEARLGLAVHHEPNGAAVLVPAYELEDAEGNVWSTVAVVDEQLDFGARP